MFFIVFLPIFIFKAAFLIEEKIKVSLLSKSVNNTFLPLVFTLKSATPLLILALISGEKGYEFNFF